MADATPLRTKAQLSALQHTGQLTEADATKFHQGIGVSVEDDYNSTHMGT